VSEGLVKIFNSKRRMIALIALVLLLLFVLRPGASRLKSRIIASISSAVGRPVEVGSVQIRLLPRPGFDLHDLVVYDDPRFGAEPMLRASEVSAALRVTSLLRGRLEVARLDLTEPSLNLVHAPQGGWNLEDLVERTAHKALAPTSKAKLEPRPAFPYIEGTSGRINFKQGSEKKPYALTNADFALWQDSENTWSVRLKAQPFRGDFNLNDTGILQLNGTWQRASLVRDTPMQFSVEWSRAQLGQLTKFFSGNDGGWRGAAQLDVALEGTPANLKVIGNVSMQDFRRYDIVSGNALKLAAHCEAQYSSLNHTFHGIDCEAPVGSGLVTLKGDMGFPGSRTFDLLLTADNVPANAVVAFAQHAKRGLPQDLAASGLVLGRLSWQQDSASASKARFEGRGEISDFRLASVSNKAEIGPVTVPFIFRTDSAVSTSMRRTAPRLTIPEGPHFEFGPFSVASGRSVTTRGWFARSGYNVELAGDADISQTLRLARMAGITALQTTAEGSAIVDLGIAGSWSGWNYGSVSGFAGPQVEGTVKLRNVHVTFRGTATPMEILTAELQLLPDAVHIEKLSAKSADAQWNGSLELPRGCSTPDACPVRFNLNANDISMRALTNWLNPLPAERPWYRVLESSAPNQPSLLATLHATGRVSANRFEMQRMAATHFTANLNLDHGKIQISRLSADTLGGQLAGEWQADFSLESSVCVGSGKLTNISLTRLAETMQKHFSGTASATYEVKGPCGTEFWPQADGTVRFTATNVVVPQISLTDDPAPVRITQLAGDARLQAGKFVIEDAKVDSDSGKFQLSGTGALNGSFDLNLARSANAAGSGFSISGTLDVPRVKPTPGLEQARLKTDPAK
jgi:hypothetical protein